MRENTRPEPNRPGSIDQKELERLSGFDGKDEIGVEIEKDEENSTNIKKILEEVKKKHDLRHIVLHWTAAAGATAFLAGLESAAPKLTRFLTDAMAFVPFEIVMMGL